MVNSVVLDDIVQSYVERVLRLFQQDMQGDRFDNVIQPPTRAKAVAGGETSPIQQTLFTAEAFYLDTSGTFPVATKMSQTWFCDDWPTIDECN